MGNNLNRSMTRRSAIQNAGKAAALTGLSLTMPPVSAQSIYGKRQVTALALTGDRYHNIDYVRTALGKTLVKDLGTSIDFTDELSLLTAPNLKQYKLLIMLRDGMIWPNGYEGAGGRGPVVSEPPITRFDQTPVYWMTVEQGKAVKEFVQN